MREYSKNQVLWLDSVPSEWQIKPLFALGFENKKLNKNLSEQNLLSLSYGKIVEKDIKSDDGLLPASFEGYQVVESGTIIFRFTDLQNDQTSLRSGIVATRGIITNAYLGFIPTGVSPRFLDYWMRALDTNKVFYGMGSGLRQSLTWEDARRIPVFLPDVAEQEVIVHYLDQETSQIDLLISKKEQLIEKLLERRQSLITQAVTKGLDPNVPMKNSGVEWLAELPAGWQVAPIWSLAQAQAGGTPESSTPEYWDDSNGTPWIAIGDMSGVLEVRETTKAVSELGIASKKLPIGRPGDVLFAMYASVGATSILGISATWNQAILGLRVRNEAADFRFLSYLLVGVSDVWKLLSNSNTQANLNQHAVMHLRVPVPPKDEQFSISLYLDTETAQIDLLVDKTRRALDLLKERRQALITQVVTGKLDVRGFASGNP